MVRNFNGMKIRQLRQSDGKTQEELANALGVTKQCVSQWENNSRYPDILLLPKIAEYFDITIDELYEHVDKKEKMPDNYVYLKNLVDDAFVTYDYLPKHLVFASKIFATLFEDYFDEEKLFESFVIDFSKDLYYDKEFVFWVACACTYIQTLKKFSISLSDKIKAENIFSFILACSCNNIIAKEKIPLRKNIKEYISKTYIEHSGTLGVLYIRSKDENYINISEWSAE